MTLWTVPQQIPLSMGFSRQEYWSGLPCPFPGNLPNSGIETACLVCPALAGGFIITVPPGTPPMGHGLLLILTDWIHLAIDEYWCHLWHFHCWSVLCFAFCHTDRAIAIDIDHVFSILHWWKFVINKLIEEATESSQSCPTLCDPMDCSPPGSLSLGILQTRILESVAMPSSRESSQLRDRTQVSHIADSLPADTSQA